MSVTACTRSTWSTRDKRGERREEVRVRENIIIYLPWYNLLSEMSVLYYSEIMVVTVTVTNSV